MGLGAVVASLNYNIPGLLFLAEHTIWTLSLALSLVSSAYGMGLRSFVALPVDKGGAVVRLTFESVKDSDTDTLTTSAAYGIDEKRTLLLGIPYRLSPAGDNRYGDLSVLYRRIIWRQDSLSGTNRLGFLGGAIVPTDKNRDAAAQVGFVFTHFKNRNEIDVDVVYQAGIDNRPSSARYDLSWQHRITPVEHPDWGIVPELNGVLELNGRWSEGQNVSHQVTAGLQWIHPGWAIEGGVAKDFHDGNGLRYLLSTRIHL